MKTVGWALQAALFYLFTAAMALVPVRARFRTGRWVGQAMCRIIAKRRAVAIDNVSRALPAMRKNRHWGNCYQTAEEIVRETFIHLGLSLVETCCLYHGKGLSLIDAIEVRGIEHFHQAVARGKGVLFLTGHCGNWELMALAFRKLFGHPVSVVARRQNNPYLNSMVERMREHYESSVIYKQNALKPIMARLKNNEIIGLLADQAVFDHDGVLIEMFGRTAWASKAPVIIARKTGAALLPIFIHREQDHHVITIHPVFTINGEADDGTLQSDTQALSRYLEDYICAHPADWYWVHRRWKRAGETVDAA
jgi:KDO2-lipid IV(A) lauroyltransferase